MSASGSSQGTSQETSQARQDSSIDQSEVDQFERLTKLYRDRPQKRPFKQILLIPPSHPNRRYRLTMTRQVIGDQSKTFGDFWKLKQVPPLATMAASGMLHQQGNSLPRLFEVYAVVMTIQVQMNIATYRRIDRTLRSIVMRHDLRQGF